MTRKYNRGPSEAQSNAEALSRRGREFAAENQTSAGIAYDYRRRQPRDLREAERMVRRAYADEVPTKLHSGTDLADDGTPAMTNRATSYIFGNAQQTDAGRGDGEFLSYYLAPFRATLSAMQTARAESTRRHAAIVSHVTIGGQDPEPAAEAEGVPSWCSRRIAFDALCSFLRQLSDVRVDARPEVAA